MKIIQKTFNKIININMSFQPIAGFLHNFNLSGKKCALMNRENLYAFYTIVIYNTYYNPAYLNFNATFSGSSRYYIQMPPRKEYGDYEKTFCYSSAGGCGAAYRVFFRRKLCGRFGGFDGFSRFSGFSGFGRFRRFRRFRKPCKLRGARNSRRFRSWRVRPGFLCGFC